MMDTVLDRFGEDVEVEQVDDEHFRVKVDVKVSPQFFGWVFGLGENVMIEYPLKVAKQMKDLLQEIVEHIGRSKYVLSRSLYSAVGKSGVHTRIVGLDRETNKELLLKHMREKGPEGAPLRELQQVLPGHNRSQIQVLLRELRNENRAYFRGNTSAAKWFAGPSSAENS